jgi:hypothetical protein
MLFGDRGAQAQPAEADNERVVRAFGLLSVLAVGAESFFAASGTYAGATVPAGVTLVAADAVSYCLQAGTGAAARHLAGPGGSPTPGRCP